MVWSDARFLLFNVHTRWSAQVSAENGKRAHTGFAVIANEAGVAHAGLGGACAAVIRSIAGIGGKALLKGFPCLGRQKAAGGTLLDQRLEVGSVWKLIGGRGEFEGWKNTTG